MTPRLFAVLRGVAIAVAIVCCIFPVLWMISMSLKRQVDIFSGFSLIPASPTFNNFVALFTDFHMGSYLMNSIIVVSVSTAASLAIGTPAAYALARFPLFGKLNSYGLMGVLFVRTLPPILLVVPLYLVLVQLHLLNTKLGLIMIYTAINTSFVIWMMHSFIAEIPVEIEEAALVDGDTRFSAMRRVMLPLASGGFVATAIFVVIVTYNDFLIALAMTSSPAAQTVPVGIASLIGKTSVQWGPMAAGGVMGTVPILVFTLLVQRHMVRGMTMGAVK